jgi:ABC-2 type transport system permease protein
MRHSVELTLARLAFRQLTSSKRSIWALVLAAIPALVAIPVGAGSAGVEDAVGDFVELFKVLIVAVLLPIVALVVGTGIFGAEVEDGTITYVLGKPVPRWRIVLTRIVVAGLATAVVLVPATLLAGVVALRTVDVDGVLPPFAAAVALGGFLYCALFVALSLSTRRALVAGLAYVVIWEGLLSRTFGGSRALSIREYTLSFAEAMSAAVAVLAAFYAIRRLRRLEIGEAA